MMERFVHRVGELVRDAQRRRLQDIADRLGDLLRNASIEIEEARVVVRGRGIMKRWLIDPSLRFLSRTFK